MKIVAVIAKYIDEVDHLINFAENENNLISCIDKKKMFFAYRHQHLNEESLKNTPISI